MILMLRLQPWRHPGAKPIAKHFRGGGVSEFCELQKQRVGSPLCLGNHSGIALE